MGHQVLRQAADFLPNTLNDAKRGVRQLSTGTTTYIADPTSGDCQAIIGNLSTDNNGNATGLSGWGIALSIAGIWFSAAPGIMRGTVPIVFSGSNTSNVATVEHGLPSSPAAVTVSAIQTLNPSVSAYVVTGSITDTTFEVGAYCSSSVSASIEFSWIAML